MTRLALLLSRAPVPLAEWIWSNPVKTAFACVIAGITLGETAGYLATGEWW